MLNYNINTGVMGLFKVQVIKNGEVVKELKEAKNLLLNAYFNFLKDFKHGNMCVVGTGTTPPTVTDTQLANKIGPAVGVASESSAVIKNTPDEWSWAYTRNFTFPIGTATGVLSEFGIYNESPSSPLLIRSLLKDQAGNPTTIIVEGDEELRLTHTIILSCTTPVVTSSFTLDGVLTEIKMGRVAAMSDSYVDSALGAFSFAFNTLTLTPNATSTDGKTIVAPSAVGGVKSPSYGPVETNDPFVYKRFFSFDSTNNPTGPVKSAFFLGSANVPTYALMFNPPFNKTSLNKFNLVIQINSFRM